MVNAMPVPSKNFSVAVSNTFCELGCFVLSTKVHQPIRIKVTYTRVTCSRVLLIRLLEVRECLLFSSLTATINAKYRLRKYPKETLKKKYRRTSCYSYMSCEC